MANAAPPPTVPRCPHCISFFRTALYGRSTRPLTNCPHTVAHNPPANHTQACVNAHWSKHKKKCKPGLSQMLTFPRMQYPGQVRVFSNSPVNFNFNHCSWAFIHRSDCSQSASDHSSVHPDAGCPAHEPARAAEGSIRAPASSTADGSIRAATEAISVHSVCSASRSACAPVSPPAQLCHVAAANAGVSV